MCSQRAVERVEISSSCEKAVRLFVCGAGGLFNRMLQSGRRPRCLHGLRQEEKHPGDEQQANDLGDEADAKSMLKIFCRGWMTCCHSFAGSSVAAAS